MSFGPTTFKVVRTSYSDIFYAQLARDVVREWKKTEEWGDTYRESVSPPFSSAYIVYIPLSLIPQADHIYRFRCGLLVFGPTDERLYGSKAYANDVALGVRAVKYDSVDAIPRTIFPEGVKRGPLFEGGADPAIAYHNLDAGWAAAARAIEMLMARVIALGGNVLGGKAVIGLVEDDGRTCGVTLADGSSIRADLVVIASGSWTASTFRELALGSETCISTG